MVLRLLCSREQALSSVVLSGVKDLDNKVLNGFGYLKTEVHLMLKTCVYFKTEMKVFGFNHFKTDVNLML